MVFDKPRLPGVPTAGRPYLSPEGEQACVFSGTESICDRIHTIAKGAFTMRDTWT